MGQVSDSLTDITDLIRNCENEIGTQVRILTRRIVSRPRMWGLVISGNLEEWESLFRSQHIDGKDSIRP